MIKKFLLGLGILFTAGCTTQSHYYVLSTAKSPSIVQQSSKSIGVEQVILPSYMDKRKLTVATSANKIVQLDSALWAEDMDTGLTQRLISFLQKRFNQPNVFGYPWGVDEQPHVKIKVQINRFLAQGDRVYLDANYVVKHMTNKTSRAYLFNTSVPTTNATEDIVNSMDSAFGRLEEHIAQRIR